MLHDENIFEHPDVFDPERFIKDPDSAKVTDLIFGTGRVSPIPLLAYSCEAVMGRDVLACMPWDTSRKEHHRTSYHLREDESELELILCYRGYQRNEPCVGLRPEEAT